MSADFSDYLDRKRPAIRPPVDRVRFTPTAEVDEFLKECKDQGLDISTIINLALVTFKPKTKPNGFSWEGIGNNLK